jgi:hypothetical protein
MKNRDRADKLLLAADDIYRILRKDLTGKRWNLAVRRAQEVVELALKGLLAEMGIDYPKIHDVAPVFRRQVEAAKLLEDADLMDLIERISSELSRKRGPAFYTVISGFSNCLTRVG